MEPDIVMKSADAKEVLIVGGNGQLSLALLEAFGLDRAVVSNRSEVGCLYLDLLDIAKQPAKAYEILTRIRPQFLIICAGLTNVELCEEESELAFQINGTAPGNLARASSQLGVRTIYISTEYVFDGKDGPYDEFGKTNPLSVYGRSKLEGELGVLGNDSKSLVVRTTVVYGPDLRAKNFVYQLVRRLRNGKCLRVSSDQISTPTYNRDLAQIISELMVDRATGIFHIAGPERLSRSEFARNVARILSLPVGLIEEVRTAELSQKAVRPLSAGLVSSRPVSPQLTLVRDTSSSLEHWLDYPGSIPIF